MTKQEIESANIDRLQLRLIELIGDEHTNEVFDLCAAICREARKP